jgi:hypothetical protein
MHIVGEEHSTKLLENFSQEAEQEMTAALRSAAEDEAEFQSEEQLEEAGDEPAGEMIETSLSKEVKLSKSVKKRLQN